MIRWTLFWLLFLCVTGAAQHIEKGGYIHSISTIPSFVVASLPTCNGGANGLVSVVTNALTPVVGATVVGGGAVQVLTHCNGTNWVVA